ncbi:MAG: 50S ribosomal protein L4 [Verrucomicrobiota bacterium]|nr:50S ribosomal protein L4 [Verrucomicrobiota bacterium]
MNKLTIYNRDGVSVGEYEVSDWLVHDRGTQAVRDAVVADLAARRAGTASTLRKGEVAGSNKKPWRQKGTGRARAGYRQSPVWRGGGVAFGPHPRDYSMKLNKKVARLAFRRALSDKIAGGQVRVLEDLTFSKPKTRLFHAMMKSLGVAPPALFVVERYEKNAALASRNLPAVELAKASDVSVFQLLRYPVLVATRAAMERLMERLRGRQQVNG